MANLPEIAFPPSSLDALGEVVRGTTLSIGNWPAAGDDHEVAPLHVHFEDDEAWYVIAGSIRFRFEDSVIIVDAGSTVLVPAGVAHTFGNAGPEPSRFILIAPSRIDQLIQELHASAPSQHGEIYRRHSSEILE